MSSSSAVVPEGRCAGDRRVQALADVPERRPRRRHRSLSSAGQDQRQLGAARPAAASTCAASASAARLLALHQQGGVVDDGEPAQRLARPAGSSWPTRRLVASSSSIVAKPAATSAGSAAVASARLAKISKPVAACGRTGTVRKVAVGDEGEGALAADDEVGQDLGGAVVIDEGVQAVAHGVLDRVQPSGSRRPTSGRRGSGRAAGAVPRAAPARPPRAGRRRPARRCRSRSRWAARRRASRASRRS